ncbi:hypothetical protein BGX38DRAFT_1280884 [Terfezia claveryi]|nr:hypothetical protein BGX38DRAFT_1280884 [Terfezia claveryi]
MGIDGKEGRERLELLFGGLGGTLREEEEDEEWNFQQVWGIFSNSIGVKQGMVCRNTLSELGIASDGQSDELEKALDAWHTLKMRMGSRGGGAEFEGNIRALNRYGKPLYVPGLLSGGTERGGDL